METLSDKIICSVCGGKGGFRKTKQDFLDTNWLDCLYCEGFGFVDNKEESIDKENDFDTYTFYRDSLIEELEYLAEVELFTTNNLGRDIYIKLTPIKRNYWVNLIKCLLKFSNHSDRINITPKQVFYIEDEQNYIYWELEIETQSIYDLQGLLDVVISYNETI